MAGNESERPFLSERRVLGLLGASVLATVAYGLVTGVTLLEGVIFFLVFAVVFVAMNYAVYRYD